MAEISAVAQTTATKTGTNPKSALGKDDFLKLLLVELQYQDPTSPMDSEKILSQTSQLASLEAQTKTNEALAALTESFGGNKNFSAVSSIGKMAKLDTAIALKNNKDGTPVATNFNLNFENAVKTGTIQIFDENNNLAKTIEISEQAPGLQNFKWDGLTDAGQNAKSGDYHIKAVYEAYKTEVSGGTLETDNNENPVPVNFEFNFQEDTPAGKIKIYNADKEVVKTINFDEKSRGVNLFSWDGKTDRGLQAPQGDYTMIATYEGKKPIILSADGGAYKIESVKFEEGKTFVKLNGNYISFDKVSEIYDGSI